MPLSATVFSSRGGAVLVCALKMEEAVGNRLWVSIECRRGHLPGFRSAVLGRETDGTGLSV